jgi:hypothetical protein
MTPSRREAALDSVDVTGTNKAEQGFRLDLDHGP